MSSRTWMFAALICSGAVVAATPTSADKARYTTEAKKAALQYQDDKKLCADEKDAVARLQCRRDAKSVYTQAMLKAKASMNAPDPAPPSTAPTVATAASPAAAEPAQEACTGCGMVTAVSVTEKAGQGSAVGMIAGGVGGAILGHQVGGGIGKDLATVAGAVGGAYAGKKIEEQVRKHKVWTVTVRYPDNSKRSFEFTKEPGYQEGDLVRNAGNSITHR